MSPPTSNWTMLRGHPRAASIHHWCCQWAHAARSAPSAYCSLARTDLDHERFTISSLVSRKGTYPLKATLPRASRAARSPYLVAHPQASEDHLEPQLCRVIRTMCVPSNLRWARATLTRVASTHLRSRSRRAPLRAAITGMSRLGASQSIVRVNGPTAKPRRGGPAAR